MVDMLVGDIKIGLAIFRRKARGHERSAPFKCSLDWSNQIFDIQFDLKSESIEDPLNQKVFRDYLKGPKGKKDKRQKSLLDVLLELDS